MDYVLLSPNDGELLKKAHQMLLDGGVKDDVGWNKRFNPDSCNTNMEIWGRSVFWYALYININEMCMDFHNHDCKGAIPITITPENLTESVNTVLAEYKNVQEAINH